MHMSCPAVLIEGQRKLQSLRLQSDRSVPARTSIEHYEVQRVTLHSVSDRAVHLSQLCGACSLVMFVLFAVRSSWRAAAKDNCSHGTRYLHGESAG